MEYAEWCKANNLDADNFSLNIWKQTPDFKEAWNKYAIKHGNNDESWRQFCYEQWKKLKDFADPE